MSGTMGCSSVGGGGRERPLDLVGMFAYSPRAAGFRANGIGQREPAEPGASPGVPGLVGVPTRGGVLKPRVWACNRVPFSIAAVFEEAVGCGFSRRIVGVDTGRIPGGVIGNTPGFGPGVPGSSPGRVVARDGCVRRQWSRRPTGVRCTLRGSVSLSETAAIVLAAGKSTRMRSARPKVLHELCGRPMLGYVFSACRLAGMDRLITVVGHGKKEVMDCFAAERDITWVEQSRQLGTGDAVACCRKAMAGLTGGVIVIAGDMPLVRAETLRLLLDGHRAAEAAVSLATTRLDDPTGYGRIVRDDQGGLLRIVEENDCSKEQKTIGEVNISYYCFDRRALFGALEHVRPDNAKGEYYITDAVHVLLGEGRRSVILPDVAPEDALGINSPADLAVVEDVMRRRMSKMQPN